MFKHDVFLIAKWFIWRSHLDEEKRDAEPLTLRKLMSLLYYAEGCSLAFNKTSLFPDKFEAWDSGPVIRRVWDVFQSDTRRIPYEESYEDEVMAIEPDARQLLQDVWDFFGAIYAAWGLREKAIRETPWLKATQHGTCFRNAEISRETMAAYFAQYYSRG